MKPLQTWIPRAVAIALALVIFSGTTGISDKAYSSAAKLPTVPMALPGPEADGIVYLTDANGIKRATTIDPKLQSLLTGFIDDMGRPIATIVMIDVKSGGILAMAQGRSPEEWGGKTHSALHTGFPAASLFKGVVTAAAFEVADVDATAPEGLLGGCSNVRPTGDWLRETEATRRSQMSLRRAYGSSCNGYYAKIAVNDLGLGPITSFARRLGWEFGVPTDFQLGKSPFFPPSPENSSTHLVGRFAAGFGNVGISAVHAAWIMLVTAHEGHAMPIRLFRDTPVPTLTGDEGRIYSASTAQRILEIMDATVRGGTGQTTFSRGKFKKLRDVVGGKTGTLTGRSPQGLTTLFAGLAPMQAPEIAIASIVVLDRRWKIKATTLAAEGIYSYFEKKLQARAVDTASFLPIASGEPTTARQ
jgi:cell division protein FtsI/penicillin-binding protein 2